MKAIVLYLHAHQPYRLRHYTVFDTASHHNYFEWADDKSQSNQAVLRKVASKSYLPTNHTLIELAKKHQDFKISLSITGTLLDQLEEWAPEALDSFKELVGTGRVEILAETYYHSLAFFYSKPEFERQVDLHRQKIEQVFGQTPKVFRNTELAYNNALGEWADEKGYKGVLAEGWDPILGWRSPNFVYQPSKSVNCRLLLKNYRLSDDIAFRFSNRNWSGWPLTAEKFCHWLNQTEPATNFNLFMDYETFGEHQWEDTGIFDFLRDLPQKWLAKDNVFMNVSEAIDKFEPVDRIDIPHTVTWADTERDLSAWLGNPMQHQAVQSLYELEERIRHSGDDKLLEDWSLLQTSDHFYYMCTKWFSDGDVHAYFSPYETPYEAFINFINAYHDLSYRLAQSEKDT